MKLFTAPSRRYDPEYLDQRSSDDAVTLQMLREIARSNRWLGGRRAVVRAMADLWRDIGPNPTVLDVGAGTGDVLVAVAREAQRRGTVVWPIGLEWSPVLAHAIAQAPTDPPISAVCGDGLALPFASRSVDVVVCSQLLHHYRGPPCHTIVRELNRVARRLVIVSDLRRSRLAAAGFWAASFALGLNSLTRRDGVISVYRGYTADELRDTITDAIPVVPIVLRHAGYRLSAHWAPV